VYWKCCWLAAAIVWAYGAAVFITGYRMARQGTPFLETGGHIYYTHPPAQTLLEKDPVSFRIALVLIGVCVVASTIELIVRLWLKRSKVGIVAVTAGGLVAIYSVFGLLFGILGLGPIGLFLVLSGLPMKTSAVRGGVTEPLAPTPSA